MSRAVWACPVAVPVFHRRDKCPRGFSLPEASWFASKPRDHGSLERGFHQLPGQGFPEGPVLYRHSWLLWGRTWKLHRIVPVSGPLWAERHFREPADLRWPPSCQV